jgi:hypothetical protein
VRDTCGSCGRDDEEVEAVRRVYITPDSWDTPGSTKVMDEIEWWCFSCRTQYPHEPVEA